MWFILNFMYKTLKSNVYQTAFKTLPNPKLGGAMLPHIPSICHLGWLLNLFFVLKYLVWICSIGTVDGTITLIVVAFPLYKLRVVLRSPFLDELLQFHLVQLFKAL